MITRTSKPASNQPYKIHASESFPKEYPRYPVLVTRFLHQHEADAIERMYQVSQIPPIFIYARGYFLDYQDLAQHISKSEDYFLNPEEEAFVQFVNVLYLFCYEKNHRGDKLKLTWKDRRAMGGVVRSSEKNVMLLESLDRGQVDEILEIALQRSDIETIRAVLNYEGYGIPVNEPNDLVIPLKWDKDRDFSELEFKITPEEWEAPLEACKAEPSLEESALQKAFAETMAENIPLRLERLLRQRDMGMLRMMLRLYGHNILPNTSSVQDVPEQSR